MPDNWTVCYQIDKFKIMSTFWFQLVVHVGVSGLANKITLEQQGHNAGYHRKDVKGQTPPKECCREEGEECLSAGIDMSRISEEINKAENELQAEVSHDAGRWENCRHKCCFLDHKSVVCHCSGLSPPFLGQGLRSLWLGKLNYRHFGKSLWLGKLNYRHFGKLGKIAHLLNEEQNQYFLFGQFSVLYLKS